MYHDYSRQYQISLTIVLLILFALTMVLLNKQKGRMSPKALQIIYFVFGFLTSAAVHFIMRFQHVVYILQTPFS